MVTTGFDALQGHLHILLNLALLGYEEEVDETLEYARLYFQRKMSGEIPGPDLDEAWEEIVEAAKTYW